MINIIIIKEVIVIEISEDIKKIKEISPAEKKITVEWIMLEL